MDRLTKTYQDGSFGVADDIPCGENSHDFKKLVIDKLGKYEEHDEVSEEQKVIEAIKVIKEYCVNKKNCSKCICNNGWCKLDGLPNDWIIEE